MDLEKNILEEKSQFNEMSSIPLRGLQHIKDYPIREYYRLIVDGRLHAKGCGWVDYEIREPRSLAGAFRGLGYALTNLQDTTLTVGYIRDLHAACMTDVDNKKLDFFPGKTKADLAKPKKSLSLFSFPDPGIEEGFFGLCEKRPDSSDDAMINLTKDGLEDLINFSKKYGGEIEQVSDETHKELVGRFIVPKDPDNKLRLCCINT